MKTKKCLLGAVTFCLLLVMCIPMSNSFFNREKPYEIASTCYSTTGFTRFKIDTSSYVSSVYSANKTFLTSLTNNSAWKTDLTYNTTKTTSFSATATVGFERMGIKAEVGMESGNSSSESITVTAKDITPHGVAKIYKATMHEVRNYTHKTQLQSYNFRYWINYGVPRTTYSSSNLSYDTFIVE